MFRFNRLFFIFTNFFISFITFFVIFLLRYKFIDFSGVEKRSITPDTIVFFILYALIIIILNIAFKIYEINKISKITESIITNYFISIISIGVFGIYFYFMQTNFARFVFFTGFLITPVILSLINRLLFLFVIKISKPVKILYFGNEENYALLESLINDYNKWFPIIITNYFTTNNFEKTNFDSKYDLFIVDSDYDYQSEVFEIINQYEVKGGHIYSLIDIFAYFEQSLPSEIIKKQHFELFSSYKLNSIYNLYIKRIGDIFISIILLIITSPIILITSLLIKITSKGPVFYSQKRVGLKGYEFNMFKFRSMVLNAEKGKALLTIENDSRITFIGKIIRPLRIDELPQLLNIFLGNMSFIGPRPERKELIDKIILTTPLFKKRLLVKPGLTGWAQVKYTYVNKLDKMNKKLSYDLYYINNLNFVFDIKILLYTLETIVFRRGAM